jgi:Mn-dependent DtxR family transcriptional regulator
VPRPRVSATGYLARHPGGWEEDISLHHFELLQTIAALTGERSRPPTLAAVAEVYGITRQAVYAKVRKLKAQGMVEADEPKAVGLVLTHNAKRLIESVLDAGITN